MPLKEAYQQFEEASQEAVAWFRGEVSKLRTSRINTELLTTIPVEHYGTRTPLNGLASVTSSDARTLVISPWDPSAMSAIEKALTQAQLGAMPIVDGKIIRLSFPMLSEETRKETVKMLHKKAEEARIRLRRGRDDALSLITREKRDGDLPEDDFFKGKEELDNRIGKANAELESIIEAKEKEIMTV